MQSGYGNLNYVYSGQTDAYARIRDRRRRQAEAEAARRQSRRRMMMAIAAGLLALLLAAAAGMMLTERAATADSIFMSRSRAVGYRSVQVQAGDTLWSIADREMGDGWTDKREFIRAVEQVNQLSGDVIHAGAYLCVPFYEDI